MSTTDTISDEQWFTISFSVEKFMRSIAIFPYPGDSALQKRFTNVYICTHDASASNPFTEGSCTTTPIHDGGVINFDLPKANAISIYR